LETGKEIKNNKMKAKKLKRKLKKLAAEYSYRQRQGGAMQEEINLELFLGRKPTKKERDIILRKWGFI